MIYSEVKDHKVASAEEAHLQAKRVCLGLEVINKSQNLLQAFSEVVQSKNLPNKMVCSGQNRKFQNRKTLVSLHYLVELLNLIHKSRIKSKETQHLKLKPQK